MNTGDILLVHTKNNKLSELIQKFQMRDDEEAGYYNHSGIIYQGQQTWVFEATQLPGRKVKAAATFTPFKDYLKDKYELLILSPKHPVNAKIMEWWMMRYNATPYDYHNLLGDQIIQYLFGWWWGRDKKRAEKRMVCHELTMRVWNKYAGIFDDWNKAMVKDIYRSEYFEHNV